MRHRATALIIRDKKLLLVLEGGYCYTPGGGIKEGETAEQALARECMEEVGVSVLAARPYFTYDCITVHRKIPQRNYCFFVEIEGVPAACDDDAVQDALWLTYEEIAARTDIIPYEQEMMYDRLREEGLI
ncbi:MAG: NUDIX hydrolase [Candidatus Uhrbacteria bacterium]|nr:NUDIX hydrolase [Candidatus Uhrbacteria bacterium]